MSITFISFLLLVIVLGVGIASFSLYIVNKLYKIQGNSLRLSILVAILTFLSGTIISALTIPFESVSALLNICAFLTPWIVGYLLYSKFFSASFGKFLVVFATCTVFWFVFAIFVALPIRAYLLEPILLQGDSMSPAFQRGDYIFFQKWDKTINKGDVVLVRIPCSDGQNVCLGIMRVSGLSGDAANGNQVASDEYYLASDNQPDRSGKVKAEDIVGKILANLGQTGIK